MKQEKKNENLYFVLWLPLTPTLISFHFHWIKFSFLSRFHIVLKDFEFPLNFVLYNFSLELISIFRIIFILFNKTIFVVNFLVFFFLLFWIHRIPVLDQFMSILCHKSSTSSSSGIRGGMSKCFGKNPTKKNYLIVKPREALQFSVNLVAFCFTTSKWKTRQVANCFYILLQKFSFDWLSLVEK